MSSVFNFKSKPRVPQYLTKYQQIFKEMLENQGITDVIINEPEVYL